jgi:hypothetical protein
MGHPRGEVDWGVGSVPSGGSRPARPEAGGCGQAVEPAHRSGACPLGQGRAGADGWAHYSPKWRVPARTGESGGRWVGPLQSQMAWAHYSPKWRGPLTSRPRPQCRGLNFLNQSISFKFEIQTCSNFDRFKIGLPELQKLGKNMVLKISKSEQLSP